MRLAVRKPCSTRRTAAHLRPERTLQSVRCDGMQPGSALEVHRMEHMRVVGVRESRVQCGGELGHVPLALILPRAVSTSQ